MPPAIGIFAAWAGSAFATYLGLTGIAATIVGGIVSMGISSIANSLIGGGSRGRGGGGTQVNDSTILASQNGNTNSIPVVYGERRIGGTRVFITTTKDTTSGEEGSKFLHLVIALCEGPIHSIKAVRLNNDVVFEGVFDRVAGEGTAGGKPALKPTDAKYYNFGTAKDIDDKKYSSKVYGEYRLGVDDQPAFQSLIKATSKITDGQWYSTSRLDRTACIYIRLEYDRDLFTGIPEIQVDVVGRTIKNIQTMQTATAGAANPVDALYDYLTDTIYGKGVNPVLLDLASFRSARTYCAEVIDLYENSTTVTLKSFSGANITVDSTLNLSVGMTISGAGYPTTGTLTSITAIGKDGALTLSAAPETPTAVKTGTTYTFTGSGNKSKISGARYLINGHIETQDPVYENVKRMLDNFNAVLLLSQGRYKLKINRPETSTGFVFNESNITGKVDMVLGGKDTKFNEVTVNFFNPQLDWQADILTIGSADDPIIAGYLAEDKNVVLNQTIDLGMVSDRARARNIAQIFMNQSRRDRVVSFTATADALAVEVMDVVRFEHEFLGIQGNFRVMGLKLNPDKTVDVTLQEYDPEVYVPLPIQPNTRRRSMSLPSPIIGVEPPTNLVTTMEPVTDRGVTTTYLRIRYTASTSDNISNYEIAVVDLGATGKSIGTVTIDIAKRLFTRANHGLVAGDIVNFTTTGALPTGIVTGGDYYVINPTISTFQVSGTRDGQATVLSGSQSGTHTVTELTPTVISTPGVTYLYGPVVNGRKYDVTVRAVTDQGRRSGILA